MYSFIEVMFVGIPGRDRSEVTGIDTRQTVFWVKRSSAVSVGVGVFLNSDIIVLTLQTGLDTEHHIWAYTGETVPKF